MRGRPLIHLHSRAKEVVRVELTRRGLQSRTAPGHTTETKTNHEHPQGCEWRRAESNRRLREQPSRLPRAFALLRPFTGRMRATHCCLIHGLGGRAQPAATGPHELAYTRRMWCGRGRRTTYFKPRVRAVLPARMRRWRLFCCTQFEGLAYVPCTLLRRPVSYRNHLVPRTSRESNSGHSVNSRSLYH